MADTESGKSSGELGTGDESRVNPHCGLSLTACDALHHNGTVDPYPHHNLGTRFTLIEYDLYDWLESKGAEYVSAD